MTVKIASVTFGCHDALMADPEGNEFDLAKAL